MTKQDVEKLFTLLEVLCPSAGKKSRDNAVLTAWALVLEPFDYEDVKAAAVIRARENRFFPDPAELVAYLPKRPSSSVRTSPEEGAKSGEVERLRERWYEQRKAWEKAGLPATAFEAKERGMSAAEWFKAVDNAGLAL